MLLRIWERPKYEKPFTSTGRNPVAQLEHLKAKHDGSDNKLLCACPLFPGRKEDMWAAERSVMVRNAGTLSSWEQLNQGREMRDEMTVLYQKISL